MNAIPYDLNQLRKLQTLMNCDPSKVPDMDQILIALQRAARITRTAESGTTLSLSRERFAQNNPILADAQKRAVDAALKE